MKRALFGAALLLAASTHRAPAATGGPDAAGHRWRDSDEPGTRPLPAPISFPPVTLQGDEAVVEVALPAGVFPLGFPYYGNRYDRCWLSSNGWLSFVDPLASAYPTPSPIPTAAPPQALVAFFWDDWIVDAVAGQSDSGDAFVVRASLTSTSGPALTGSVEVTLWPSGCMTFFYTGEVAAMVGGATTIGIESPDGSVGLVYMEGGVPRSGASFRSGYAIDLCPQSSLGCPAPARVLALNATAPAAGDTNAGSNTVESYHCTGSGTGPRGGKTGYSGPEEVWELTLPAPGVLWLDLEPAVAGLEVFLLGACDGNDCRFEADGSETLPAGSYRVVVDGKNGAAGSYTLWPRLGPPQPPYQLWFDCPEGQAATPMNQEQRQSKKWSFDSNNFCGTGCDFSLFAVVGCGSEMHLPLWDVETGHVRVRDVFSGRAVDLVATNRLRANPGLPPTCELESWGTDVSWQDSTCTNIPCPAMNCGGGSDCRTNNVVMGVAWLGEPYLCGVYEVSFLNWGGFVWDAFANCTQDQTEQFAIHRDLAAALAAWDPRPEVGIAGHSFDERDCSSSILTGTLTLENAGCLDARQVLVTLDEAPPATPHPESFRVDVPAGAQVTIPWSYRFDSMPANLVFRVDPTDELVECGEALGSAVGCGRSARLVDQLDFSACDLRCASRADAGDALEVCAGSTAVLDGAATYLRCSAPLTPEYRWLDSVGQAVPGCDWGASTRCVVPESYLPRGKSRFELAARCGGSGATCETRSGTAVIVGRNVTPGGLGNSLWLARSGRDLAFDWSSARSLPAGSFRVYRDAVATVPATTRALAADVSAPATSAREPGAVDAGPALVYYQAIGVSCAGDLEGGY